MSDFGAIGLAEPIGELKKSNNLKNQFFRVAALVNHAMSQIKSRGDALALSQMSLKEISSQKTKASVTF